MKVTFDLGDLEPYCQAALANEGDGYSLNVEDLTFIMFNTAAKDVVRLAESAMFCHEDEEILIYAPGCVPSGT